MHWELLNESSSFLWVEHYPRWPPSVWFQLWGEAGVAQAGQLPDKHTSIQGDLEIHVFAVDKLPCSSWQPQIRSNHNDEHLGPRNWHTVSEQSWWPKLLRTIRHLLTFHDLTCRRSFNMCATIQDNRSKLTSVYKTFVCHDTICVGLRHSLSDKPRLICPRSIPTTACQACATVNVVDAYSNVQFWKRLLNATARKKKGIFMTRYSILLNNCCFLLCASFLGGCGLLGTSIPGFRIWFSSLRQSSLNYWSVWPLQRLI